MRLLYPKVVQQRHHLLDQISDAVLEPALAPYVEGDRPEVARERGNLLEPPPATETESPY